MLQEKQKKQKRLSDEQQEEQEQKQEQDMQLMEELPQMQQMLCLPNPDNVCLANAGTYTLLSTPCVTRFLSYLPNTGVPPYLSHFIG